MAVEAARGCGFRRAGGLYLIGEGMAAPCDRLPLSLHICRVCGQGIKQTRGYSRIDLHAYVGDHTGGIMKPRCVDPDGDMICHPHGPAFLMWVGSGFYTPESFIDEASRLGVSKRVPAIPRGVEIGDWILLAHPEAAPCPAPDPPPGDPPEDCEVCEGKGKIPGIFYAFRLTRIELILKESEATPDRIAEEAKRGVTVVPVPDNDPDHQGGGKPPRRARKTRPEGKPLEGYGTGDDEE